MGQLLPKYVETRPVVQVHYNLPANHMDAIRGNKCEARSLAGVIAAHRFTEGMKPEHQKRLLESAMFKHFDGDELVFREGELANRFYLICRGKIALESGGEGATAPLVQMIGEDEVLGWSWFFPPYYWHFTARVVEPTDAVFFYGTRLRAQCEEDPAFGYDLMKRIAAVVIKRLQFTRAQLLQLQQASNRISPPH